MIKDILLAEVDPLDAELTLAALGQGNLAERVTLVENGEQALDYLFYRGVYENRAEGHPILILLDIKMPKIGGLEVLKATRAEEHLKTFNFLARDTRSCRIL